MDDDDLRPPRYVDLGSAARHDHVPHPANEFFSFEPAAKIEVETRGRPILILLQPTPQQGKADGGVRVSRRGEQTYLGAHLRLTRDGEPISGVSTLYESEATVSLHDSTVLPPSAISFIDLEAPAGKHVYELEAQAYPGCILWLDYTRIVAVELGG